MANENPSAPAAPPAPAAQPTQPHYLTKATVDVTRTVKGVPTTKTIAPDTVVKPGTFTDAEIETLIAQRAIEPVNMPAAE